MAILEGVCSISIVAALTAPAIRRRFGVVTITAHSSLAVAALAYVTQSLGWTATLTAGDVLIIDVDEMTVELNGVNVVKDFTGVFPLLYTGANELRWRDGDAGRDLDLEVKHSPRWV